MNFRFFSVLLVAAVLTACGGQPQQQTLSSDPQNTPLPSTAQVSEPASTSITNDSVSSSTGDTTSVTEQGSSSDGIVPGSVEDFKNSADDTVFFETNKHFISNEGARALRAQARWLRKYPEKRILIEGNCDERGTREYNYALGNRRAFAVRDFLISQGIPSYRIKTVSYGKDKPEFLGSNDTAWSLNRRAVTVITE